MRWEMQRFLTLFNNASTHLNAKTKWKTAVLTRFMPQYLTIKRIQEKKYNKKIA